MKRRRPRGEPPTAPEPEAAFEIAARYLGARPRTRWEIERRLRRAGVSDEVLAATLERLARLGYLDDDAFARYWAEQRDRHAPRGKRMVEAELRQRGVPREVIERLRGEPATRAPGDEVLPGSEEERAALALERHLRGRLLPDDPKGLQRIGAFLMRRGFDPETVRATIRAAAAARVGEEDRT